MINTEMRLYDYFQYEDENAYGQPRLSDKKGQIKLAIYTTNQSVQDNIRYKDATYLGVTHESINDSFVIQYGEEKLKVLYVNPQGRYKLAYMKNL